MVRREKTTKSGKLEEWLQVSDISAVEDLIESQNHSITEFAELEGAHTCH